MPSSLWSCLLLLSGTRYYLFNSASSYPWPGESQVKYYEPEKAFLYCNTNPCDDNGFRTYTLFLIKMACCIILTKDQSPPRFQVLPSPSMSMFLCSPSAPSAVLEPQDTQVFRPMYMQCVCICIFFLFPLPLYFNCHDLLNKGTFVDASVKLAMLMHRDKLSCK